jgi:hypothetical protein
MITVGLFLDGDRRGDLKPSELRGAGKLQAADGGGPQVRLGSVNGYVANTSTFDGGCMSVPVPLAPSTSTTPPGSFRRGPRLWFNLAIADNKPVNEAYRYAVSGAGRTGTIHEGTGPASRPAWPARWVRLVAGPEGGADPEPAC